MSIKNILVNDMTQALGIDSKTPVFHILWENEAVKKVSFQVFDQDENCIWVKKIENLDSPYIYYDGPELNPKSSYRVSLTSDEKHGGSAETVFETGFLGSAWEAGWIEPVQEDAIEEKALSFFEMIMYKDDGQSATRLRPCQEIIKDFTIDGVVKRARVYATAHGVYQLYVNGTMVSSRRLAPEISCYEENLYYQTYDITEHLQEGENTVGAILADGWWIGRLGMAGDSCNYGNRLGFLMQMEIEYMDGQKEIIVSDRSMVGRPSHICYSDLFIGEKWDMTILNNHLKNEKLYENDTWKNCLEVSYAMDNLYGQPVEPVTVTEILNNPQIITTPQGDLVLDFGQVLAGVVHLEFEAKCGDVLVLEHSEVLDENGNFKCNIAGRNKDQKDVYVCGEGVQIFEPRFTYHGFRYVRVSGIKRAQIIEAQVLVLGTPIKKIGHFYCSDERLNQLQHNIEWSTRSNMFSVPTDCPQREKLGWTGDIQVFAKTGCFNYDLKNFLENWLKNMRIDQTDNGEIPVVIPNQKHQDRIQRVMSNGDNSSSVWGDACVLVPYYLYRAYGDVQVLKDNFEMMQKWLGFIDSVCKRKPEGYEQMSDDEKARNEFLWTKCYHFGDWLIPSLRALPGGVQIGTEKTAAVVGSSYYAFTLKNMIEICHILGATKLAKEYEARLVLVKDAVAKTFVSEDGTVNDCDLQGLYVMILACEIVDGDLKRKVVEKLVQLIKENDYCLDTGFSSVSYLLDVLYDNGYADVAYKLLFQTKCPSWLYMVENGATSIWENWAAVTPEGIPTDSSYNHYAFGCVGDWIYRHIGGIQMLEPGYKKIRISPDIHCGLTWAKCSLETPYGHLECAWDKTDNGYCVKVMIPQGVTGILEVDGEEKNLCTGTYTF